MHAVPDPWRGPLQRQHFENDVAKRLILLGHMHCAGFKRFQDARQIALEDGLCLLRIDTEIGDLHRRRAAPEADVQTSAAQLVEHGDLFGEAQGMIERQRINHRAKAQLLRALCDGAEENIWRRRHAERCRVMFGQMIGVEAGTIINLDQLQAFLIVALKRLMIVVEMIEDAEFHRLFAPGCLASPCHSPSQG